VDLAFLQASEGFCRAQITGGGVGGIGGGVEIMGGEAGTTKGDGGRVLGLAFGLNRPRSPLVM